MALSWPEVAALGQILMIDLTLAGDNAIVVGMAAATVPKARRKLVIVCGVGVAVSLRIGFALIARRMLSVISLTLSGGILLLWVAWKLFRQLWKHKDHIDDLPKKHQTVLAAIFQIAIADLSMSLDNVLAVAGAAQGHPAWVLVGGLGVAVILMAFMSHMIAKLLYHLPWISWLGLMIVVFVAGRMIWLGGGEVFRNAT